MEAARWERETAGGGNVGGLSGLHGGRPGSAARRERGGLAAGVGRAPCGVGRAPCGVGRAPCVCGDLVGYQPTTSLPR